SHVHINIDIAADRLVMTIADNGRGFSSVEKHSSRKEAQGLGLSTMRERARLLKGDLEVSSILQQGTTIQLKVPVAPKE
ncbi:MAG: histidine kinase, partial [Candidatus Omnitrophica bacterium]|nr:histidine kinase [Candidatus Omnitrophota bacterium]